MSPLWSYRSLVSRIQSRCEGSLKSPPRDDDSPRLDVLAGGGDEVPDGVIALRGVIDLQHLEDGLRDGNLLPGGAVVAADIVIGVIEVV